jgi:hypothetical protein
MDSEEAREFIEFNIEGAYMGPRHPRARLERHV